MNKNDNTKPDTSESLKDLRKEFIETGREMYQLYTQMMETWHQANQLVEKFSSIDRRIKKLEMQQKQAGRTSKNNAKRKLAERPSEKKKTEPMASENKTDQQKPVEEIFYDPTIKNQNKSTDHYNFTTGNHNNFMYFVQRNPYMRKTVLRAAGGRCVFCGQPINPEKDEYELHHINYDNDCVYTVEERQWMYSPTARNPKRKVQVPDCETCSKEHNASFSQCFMSLVPIHPKCHQILHGHETPEHEYRTPFSWNKNQE